MEQELNEQLEHHGTKGMKWGERRYQYKDGSLTPAGKKRYAKDVERLKAKNEKLANKIKGKQAQEAAMKRVAKLKAEAEAKKQALKDGAKANVKYAKKAIKEAEADAKKLKREEEIEKSLEKDNTAMTKKKLEIARSGDPKKIAANSHLFSDTEIANLKLRMDNEAAIQEKIPASKKNTILKALYKDIVVPTTNNVLQDYLKNALKGDNSKGGNSGGDKQKPKQKASKRT